jgi:hypothetical protein
MYSDAADLAETRAAAPGPQVLPTHPWQNFPISQVAHHGQSCCEIAREWVVAMDSAQLNGSSTSSGPRWLREKFEWGPSPWPIHWCEIVSRKVIDCGAHSALAHEAFRARGLTAFRAQFIQRYSADALEQWRQTWTEQSVSDHWLGEDVIYHEANAILVNGDALKLWDSSAGWWIDPQQQAGYGSLSALRIFTDAGEGGAHSEGASYRWGAHRIRPNEWYFLEKSPEPL